MAFSDFKRLAGAVKQFHLHPRDQLGYFASCADLVPGDSLTEALRRGAPLAAAIGTEKARSEWIVAPLLLELKNQCPEIGLFSGIDLTVDSAAGLSGTCDFLLSRGPEQHMLVAPVVALVEAKRDDIHEGLGQCLAEMVAAQIFNQREEQSIPAVYGAVTTGTIWKFMGLSGQSLVLDLDEYYLSQPGRILGILRAMALGLAPQPTAPPG